MTRIGLYAFMAATMTSALLALGEAAAAQEFVIDQNQTDLNAGDTAIIMAHDVCRVVENRSGNRIMIPMRQATEWSIGGGAFARNASDMRGVDIVPCPKGMDATISVSQPYGRPSSTGVSQSSDVILVTTDSPRSPTCTPKPGNSWNFTTNDDAQDMYNKMRGRIDFSNTLYCWESFRKRTDSNWSSGDNDRWQADYLTRYIRVWPE